MEALAKKLIKLFSDINHNQTDIDAMAWWTVKLSQNHVLARILFFAERVMHWSETKNERDR